MSNFENIGERLPNPNDEPSGRALVESFIEYADSSAHGYGAAETREYGRQVMCHVLRELGIPDEVVGEVVDVPMVRSQDAADSNRWVVDDQRRPITVGDYLGTGMAAKHGAEDPLLDIAEKGIGDPGVREYAQEAIKSILGYTPQEDPRVEALNASFDAMLASEVK